jgi:hypothetical protein
MVISSHFLAGAAIGRATGNPILAVLFGLLLHLVMDLVPHWNYSYSHLRKVKTLLLVLLDPFLAFAIFAIIGSARGFDGSMWLNTILGGAACVLPDLAEFIIRSFKIKSLIPFIALHRKIHWFDKQPKNIWESAESLNPDTAKRVFWGIVYQVPFLIISIYFLIK